MPTREQSRPARVDMRSVFTSDELALIGACGGTWVWTADLATFPLEAWSPFLHRLDLPDLAARARYAIAAGSEAK